jgi:hypothetical protein
MKMKFINGGDTTAVPRSLSSVAKEWSKDSVEEISVGDIEIDENDARSIDLDIDFVDRLEQVFTHGDGFDYSISMIVVRKVGSRYKIVRGRHRLTAIRNLGYKGKIWAIIVSRKADSSSDWSDSFSASVLDMIGNAHDAGSLGNKGEVYMKQFIRGYRDGEADFPKLVTNHYTPADVTQNVDKIKKFFIEVFDIRVSIKADSTITKWAERTNDALLENLESGTLLVLNKDTAPAKIKRIAYFNDDTLEVKALSTRDGNSQESKRVVESLISPKYTVFVSYDSKERAGTNAIFINRLLYMVKFLNFRQVLGEAISGASVPNANEYFGYQKGDNWVSGEIEFWALHQVKGVDTLDSHVVEDANGNTIRGARRMAFDTAVKEAYENIGADMFNKKFKTWAHLVDPFLPKRNMLKIVN